MRIAFCLRGIAYQPSYRHWSKGQCQLDIANAHDNHQLMLFQPMQRAGHQVDYYIRSYHSERDQYLQATYQPVTMELISGSTGRSALRRTVVDHLLALQFSETEASTI
jgi:hypothetical protein